MGSANRRGALSIISLEPAQSRRARPAGYAQRHSAQWSGEDGRPERRTRRCFPVNPILLLFLLLACLVSCQTSGTGDQTKQPSPQENRSTAQTPPTPVPPHQLNEVWRSGKSVWLFIVVDGALTEQEARTIIEFYEPQYADAVVLNIDLFCDATYAHHSIVDDPSITDSQFYAHTLYSYMTGKLADHSFRTPSEPGMGTACK